MAAVMNGIFSPRPCQTAIRLMIGTHLLLIIEAGCLAWSTSIIDMPLRLILGGTALLAIFAFASAVHGGSGGDGEVWRPRRHMGGRAMKRMLSDIAGRARRPAATLLLTAAFPAAALANSATIGRTWPIAEPDALAELEARAARQPPNMAASFGPRSGWSAMQSAPLARVTQDRTRYVIPFYTLDQEVRLPDGKLLYPKGFTFNPLSYVSLPQRLVIVTPRDLPWALDRAALTDFILLASGGASDADAITLGERHGRALFILEDRVKERLGVTHAPVIVRQVGQRLELREMRVDPHASAQASQ
jgi:conjugal transfer pilus assembly protein TraW